MDDNSRIQSQINKALKKLEVITSLTLQYEWDESERDKIILEIQTLALESVLCLDNLVPQILKDRRIIDRTIEVFGDDDKAFAWITSANQALSGKRPLDLLDSKEGKIEVFDLLGRIEHNAHS